MVAHLDGVTCLAVDPNGLFVVSGSKQHHSAMKSCDWVLISDLGHDCSLRLWNFETKACVQEMTSHRKKHEESICDVAFHPSKPMIGSAGADAIAKVFMWIHNGERMDAAWLAGSELALGCSLMPAKSACSLFGPIFHSVVLLLLCCSNQEWGYCALAISELNYWFPTSHCSMMYCLVSLCWCTLARDRLGLYCEMRPRWYRIFSLRTYETWRLNGM